MTTTPEPLADWRETLDEALKTGQLVPCSQCDEPCDPERIVYDAAQWSPHAEPFCSDECLELAQERDFERRSFRADQ